MQQNFRIGNNVLLPEFIETLLRKYDVADFTVGDVDIETVIKNIYCKDV